MGSVTRIVDVYGEIEERLGQVPGWMTALPPAALPATWELMRDFYFAETRIPSKYKELIGVAVAAATRDRYGQVIHSEGARLAGATDDEIAEAGMMAGVTMLGATFLNAIGCDLDELARETDDISQRLAYEASVNAPRRPGGPSPTSAPPRR